MNSEICVSARKLEEEFKYCHKILNAVGDEMRQHLICVMMEGCCDGSRVVDIAQKTNLSRPAVSHHMQILKDAGIVKSRREGTCIYYYLDPDGNEMKRLAALVEGILDITGKLPNRSGEE